MFGRKPAADTAVLVALRTGLREAAAWCELAPRDVSHARAAALLPTTTDAKTEETPLFRMLSDPVALMTSVARARRDALATSGARVPWIAEFTVSRGRLLLCEFSASLFDRACHEESRGFLDEDDLPPCGAWCGLVPARVVRAPSPNTLPALVVWIPERHVPDLDAAIPCCPTEVNAWLDDVDPKLARALLRAD